MHNYTTALYMHETLYQILIFINKKTRMFDTIPTNNAMIAYKVDSGIS